MSLPITAVGPLKVETNPILMESAAVAGDTSARAVAPASQNAVFIFTPLLVISMSRQPGDLRNRAAAVLVLGSLGVSCDVFCARNRQLAASPNRRITLRTFGSCPRVLHHSSQQMPMARIIVLVGR